MTPTKHSLASDINVTHKHPNLVRSNNNHPTFPNKVGRKHSLPLEVKKRFDNLPFTNMTTEEFLAEEIEKAREEGREEERGRIVNVLKEITQRNINHSLKTVDIQGWSNEVADFIGTLSKEQSIEEKSLSQEGVE